MNKRVLGTPTPVSCPGMGRNETMYKTNAKIKTIIPRRIYLSHLWSVSTHSRMKQPSVWDYLNLDQRRLVADTTLCVGFSSDHTRNPKRSQSKPTFHSQSQRFVAPGDTLWERRMSHRPRPRIKSVKPKERLCSLIIFVHKVVVSIVKANQWVIHEFPKEINSNHCLCVGSRFVASARFSPFVHATINTVVIGTTNQKSPSEHGTKDCT